MNINLVNQYYDKLYLSSAEYNELKNVKKKKDIIMSSLNNLINSNNIYLLNNSLLNYLSSLDNIVYELDILSSNSINQKIDSLTHYYRSIIFDILNSIDSTCVKELDDDSKFATNYAATLIRIINNDVDKHYMGNKLLLKKIIYVLLCYCHINNKMNDYKNLCDKYVYNFSIIVDDMNLNGLVQLDDLFVSRVIDIIESTNNKKNIK